MLWHADGCWTWWGKTVQRWRNQKNKMIALPYIGLQLWETSFGAFEFVCVSVNLRLFQREKNGRLASSCCDHMISFSRRTSVRLGSVRQRLSHKHCVCVCVHTLSRHFNRSLALCWHRAWSHVRRVTAVCKQFVFCAKNWLRSASCARWFTSVWVYPLRLFAQLSSLGMQSFFFHWHSELNRNNGLLILCPGVIICICLTSYRF